MLNVSKSIYAGWGTGTTAGLFVAQICPDGKSANEKRKIDKFTAMYSTVTEYENTALPGFTLLKSIYTKGDIFWLIIDPRGFLTHISTRNLEEILKVTGITEGLIQEKCVWAREDSHTTMKLIPVSSPEYLDVIKNTELIDNKVDITEVDIGDIVLLQNGLQGEYMGVLSLYGSAGYISEFTKCNTFLRKQVVKISPSKYFYHSDAKILKIIDKSGAKKTKVDSCNDINNDINTNSTFFVSDAKLFNHGYYNSSSRIKFVSKTSIHKPPLSLVEIDRAEADSLFAIMQTMHDSVIMAVEKDNTQYLLERMYSSTTHFRIIKIKNNLDGVLTCETRGFARNTYEFDYFDKFYKIVKHVKDETYI